VSWISFMIGAVAATVVIPLLGVALFCVALYFDQKKFLK
jgi:Zn-dependent membrane protease YugP